MRIIDWLVSNIEFIIGVMFIWSFLIVIVMFMAVAVMLWKIVLS